MKKAIIDTIKGKMEVEFYENDAPKTVQNFVAEPDKIEEFFNLKFGNKNAYFNAISTFEFSKKSS